ncbi:pilus assembly protein N-terminal domain-containing protein [Archangium primigenium]|uniref:pilus assembly protein N-terminal domain-containing protein n=1 Tax=[Archangium] primigenium TaxID=2792470 RepID=UPI00195EB16B|nr:pilus assembly protein N-terminal domain-containing protein [Archangium primigenium]MBM7112388.1 pilus assembly protein N-terminal domain-containing protein [Archangium primigenium]
MNMRRDVGMLVVLAGVLGSTAGAVQAAEPTKKTAEAPQETITLKKGEHRDLTIPGLTRMSLGDDTVADIESMGGGTVRVSGVGPGKTTLVVWANDARHAYLIVVK